ncbi:2-oxo acid dehydrogenase subunit E2 [Henriciella litoralis]|uniref:2-oxo acid dehydrogenase subunit E2 n=1 Tax=Henriciella litoralis TaxID=568102 RepID=UPI000A015680|nr:2-oxo acid dehydrogenase subunit E2 [Henriciella litoralis]
MITHQEIAKTIDPSDAIVAELEALGLPQASYSIQALDVTRKTVARRLTESFRDVPHFALQCKVEMDALLACRKRFNVDQTNASVTINDLIIKACALAIKRFPAVNSSFTQHGILRHHNADIAVAVAIEGGLITPIVRHAETKSLTEISAEVKDLAARAKRKRLQPHEYFGGTFSVSNLGMFGVSSFGSILNPPQGCILSIGAPEKQYVFDDGDEPRIAQVLTPTLTCDHRVVDGATGAQWLQEFKTLVEKPEDWVLGG